MNSHPSTALVVAALLFAGCGRQPAEAPSRGEKPPAIPVRVITVETKPLTGSEEVSGTVRARLRATIEAKVSGRIIHMNATPGRQVRAGELLVELDARETQARLDQAIASRDQAQRDALRFQKLLTQQAVTPAEAEAVESRLVGAQAAVAEAETMLGYVRITAPFAGVVTRKLADVGDLAMPGRATIELEDPTTLRLEADVPESLAERLSTGAKLFVHIGATEVEGTVSELAPAADPVSRTFPVKLDLPAIDGLRSGQFGRVRVPTTAGAGLHVPVSAVLQRGQLEFVHVVEGGHARLRLVKTGRRAVDEVELLSGVSSGEQVVVAPASSLRDGQPVLVQP